MSGGEIGILKALQGEDLRLTEMHHSVPFDVLWNDVSKLLQRCVTEGQLLDNPAERRQVRGILQYWATQQYRHTGTYELHELIPLRRITEIATRISTASTSVGSGGTNQVPKKVVPAKKKGATTGEVLVARVAASVLTGPSGYRNKVAAACSSKLTEGTTRHFSSGAKDGCFKSGERKSDRGGGWALRDGDKKTGESSTKRKNRK